MNASASDQLGRADHRTLGGRIKAARVRQGLLQRQLAERVGVSPRAVRWWEANEREPKLATLARIARVLVVDLGWLLEGPGATSWERERAVARAERAAFEDAAAALEERARRGTRLAGGASPVAGRPAPQVGAAPTSPDGTQPEGAPRRGV